MISLPLVRFRLLRVSQLRHDVDRVQAAQLILIVLESEDVDNRATTGHNSNVGQLCTNPFNRARGDGKNSSAIKARNFETIENELTGDVYKLDFTKVITAKNFVSNRLLLLLWHTTARAK